MILLGLISILWIPIILFYCDNNKNIEVDDIEEDGVSDLQEVNDDNCGIKQE